MGPLPDMMTSGTERPLAEPAPSQGTVLLVDDDLPVRRVTARYLALLGYAVLEAADATEALALARSEARIDLVLSDIALPGMRGPALLRDLRALRPTVGAVLMSGFAEEALRPEGWPTNTKFLNKPFDRDALHLVLTQCRTALPDERNEA